MKINTLSVIMMLLIVGCLILSFVLVKLNSQSVKVIDRFNSALGDVSQEFHYENLINRGINLVDGVLSFEDDIRGGYIVLPSNSLTDNTIFQPRLNQIDGIIEPINKETFIDVVTFENNNGILDVYISYGLNEKFEPTVSTLSFRNENSL